MEWTEERIETLKNLWGKGFSARQIAEELGGVTRNAVIGKANRLGLSKPTKSAITRKQNRVQQVQAPRIVIPEPQGEGATILTLKSTSCRWPIGHPGEENFRFCGARCAAGAPYCEAHARMAYQPSTKDSRRRSA